MKHLWLAVGLFVAYAIGFSLGVEKGRSECAAKFKRTYPPDADWSSRLLHPSSRTRVFN